MAIKLDMSKAYERVEWSFLKQMLSRLGFNAKWIELLMECITIVSYTVSINSDHSETFQLTQGLRQGDPLSPYMFLICVDAFSVVMNKSVRN